jgi:hypothetical protein
VLKVIPGTSTAHDGVWNRVSILKLINVNFDLKQFPEDFGKYKILDLQQFIAWNLTEGIPWISNEGQPARQVTWSQPV